MADHLPQNFQLPPSNKITSYSITDAISGKGYVTFYGGQSNAAESLGLSLLQFYTDEVTHKTESFTASVTPAKTKVLDRDYDIDFKVTTIIEGLCFVNVPNGVHNVSSAGQNHEHYVIVKLRKWDGATETEIASATGRTHPYGPLPLYAERHTIDAFSFTIAPGTIIKAGESLRLTVEIWHSAGGAVESRVFIGQDPKNRSRDEDSASDQHDWGNLSTQLTLHLPTKLF